MSEYEIINTKERVNLRTAHQYVSWMKEGETIIIKKVKD